jgi:Xaa-Pro aminopeptidase
VTLDRITRLQLQLKPSQFFYITNLINVRYLSGFTGSNAALLISDSTAVLATDSRYEIQAAQQVPDLESVIGRNFPELLMSKLPKSEVLVEGAHLSVDSFAHLTQTYHHQFTSTTGVIEKLRSVKDESEIGLIKQACEISTRAYLSVIETVRVGQTERSIRNELERCMRDLGADDIAFESIVASGPNSAIPHHEPTDRQIQSGDFLKIDFGAKIHGYHADCTRTSVIGKPAEWQIDLHAAVTTAQHAGRDVIRAGIEFREVESSVNQSLSASGYREYFTHGLGHGVGLAIHEDPFFGRVEDAKIAPNTVITIEPGAYLKDQGGVRVEDTIVVHSNGYENLTNLPYELLEL